MTTKQNKDYDVFNIPLNKIYKDDSFNCRGEITIDSVYSLAEDIKKRGLDSPIVVMPFTKIVDGNVYEYKIISGHRRYTAHVLLKAETIPCFIRESSYSETDAIIENLQENLERRDLNILQEAKAIRHLTRSGKPAKEIARLIGKGTRWVEQRLGLFILPEFVQEAAANGLIKPTELETLIDLKRSGRPLEEIIKFANKCKDKHNDISITTTRVLKNIQRSSNPSLFKLRPKNEIEHVHDLILDAMHDFPNLATYALAWTIGAITTKTFLAEIEKEAAAYGYTWIMPHNYIVNENAEIAEYNIETIPKDVNDESSV